MIHFQAIILIFQQITRAANSGQSPVEAKPAFGSRGSSIARWTNYYHMVHVGISKTKTTTSKCLKSSHIGTSIQSKSCMSSHSSINQSITSIFHHSQATISKIPLRGSIQDSLYSKRFFFPKFPHQLFLQSSQSF